MHASSQLPGRLLIWPLYLHVNKKFEDDDDECVDISFIRRNQKECRNSKFGQTSPTSFWLNLINFISKDTIMVYLSYIITRFIK